MIDQELEKKKPNIKKLVTNMKVRRNEKLTF